MYAWEMITIAIIIPTFKVYLSQIYLYWIEFVPTTCHRYETVIREDISIEYPDRKIIILKFFIRIGVIPKILF